MKRLKKFPVLLLAVMFFCLTVAPTANLVYADPVTGGNVQTDDPVQSEPIDPKIQPVKPDEVKTGDPTQSQGSGQGNAPGSQGAGSAKQDEHAWDYFKVDVFSSGMTAVYTAFVWNSIGDLIPGKFPAIAYTQASGFKVEIRGNYAYVEGNKPIKTPVYDFAKKISSWKIKIGSHEFKIGKSISDKLKAWNRTLVKDGRFNLKKGKYPVNSPKIQAYLQDVKEYSKFPGGLSIPQAMKLELKKAWTETFKWKSPISKTAAKTKAGGWVGMALSIGFTTYDYGWGEKKDKGLASTEYAAGLITDLGVGLAVGFASAALAGLVGAGIVALTGVALPGIVIGAIAVGIGILIGTVIESWGPAKWVKDKIHAGVNWAVEKTVEGAKWLGNKAKEAASDAWDGLKKGWHSIFG